MRPAIAHLALAAAVVYAGTVAMLANLPAWQHLPDQPVSISAATCPSAPVTLRADRRLVTPLVLAAEFERGAETSWSKESCDWIAATVRARAPGFDHVPKRFICRSVRAHAHELWLDADLWPGPHLWVIDDRAVGAGTEGFAEQLISAGLRYVRVGDDVEIVVVESPVPAQAPEDT